MEVEIRVRPHTTVKDVFGKQVVKSFNQDFVDMKTDDGGWRHIGYYSYPAKTFSGLSGWDNSLNDCVAAAIAKIKGNDVSFAKAPSVDIESESEEGDEDELE